ncbi:DUF3710 domain-containing protein [Propionibacteriaceae bacterium Y1685]|uniref:DUF3710 domain-containing protein n=1 Tax=Microlunatus sp. Y1700 TaxID=3418487 RepID=UPI003B7EE51B
MIFDRLRGRKKADEVDDIDDIETTDEVSDADSEDAPVTSKGRAEGSSNKDSSSKASTSDEVDAEEDDDDSDASEVDWDALDDQDWRTDGPYDLGELDDDALDEHDPMRIDLGSLIVTGFEGMELRLQIAEETQQIVSALMIKEDSALEIAAFAAPRSGGLWSELREEIIESTNAAGGSVSQVEGPYGTELRRLLPVRTPDGDEGYQPSRMWVAQGPRWCLRGVLYGQASVVEGLDGPVEPLIDAFRKIIVRRGDDAMAPGDLLPLQLPEGAQKAD